MLIFNKQNQILLGERINSHRASSFSPSGGHLEFGKSFEKAAIREVREETSLVINFSKVVAITDDVFRLEDKHYISIF